MSLRVDSDIKWKQETYEKMKLSEDGFCNNCSDFHNDCFCEAFWVRRCSEFNRYNKKLQQENTELKELVDYYKPKYMLRSELADRLKEECTGIEFRLEKLQQENAELKEYKEKWQETSGKANAVNCLQEVDRLEKENTILKQVVEKAKKCISELLRVDDLDKELSAYYIEGFRLIKLAQQTQKEISELMKQIKLSEGE